MRSVGDLSRVAAVSAVAVLNDPVRRALFDAVRRAPAALTREDAAAAVGISRKLAAFHLDKLVEVGLLRLDSSPEAAAARRGRVGRRPKCYRPAEAGVQVSIPPRRTNLLAELLLEAISTTRSTEDAIAAALRVARRRGRAVGEPERPQRSRRMGAERALALLRSLLDRLDYEPTQAGTGPVQFRSCPFHPMSTDSPEVVCRIHHAYVSGVVEGLDLASVEATLAPGSDGCCVELRPRTR
jgi:predicted ArsR family transcriptional regulator